MADEVELLTEEEIAEMRDDYAAGESISWAGEVTVHSGFYGRLIATLDVLRATADRLAAALVESQAERRVWDTPETDAQAWEALQEYARVTGRKDTTDV